MVSLIWKRGMGWVKLGHPCRVLRCQVLFYIRLLQGCQMFFAHLYFFCCREKLMRAVVPQKADALFSVSEKQVTFSCWELFHLGNFFMLGTFSCWELFHVGNLCWQLFHVGNFFMLGTFSSWQLFHVGNFFDNYDLLSSMREFAFIIRMHTKTNSKKIEYAKIIMRNFA